MLCKIYNFDYPGFKIIHSDSARHRALDICPPNSQIFLKNVIDISLIIKECPEEILIKLAVVLKSS
jgi:hypothetical protein